MLRESFWYTLVCVWSVLQLTEPLSCLCHAPAQVCQVSAQQPVQTELLMRYHQLQSRLATLKIENEEVRAHPSPHLLCSCVGCAVLRSPFAAHAGASPVLTSCLWASCFASRCHFFSLFASRTCCLLCLIGTKNSGCHNADFAGHADSGRF